LINNPASTDLSTTSQTKQKRALLSERLLRKLKPAPQKTQQKLILTLLTGLSLLACIIALLGLPKTAQWFPSAGIESSTASLADYLQGKTNALGLIRVADQNDPARLESSKLSTQDAKIAEFFSRKYRLAGSEIEKYIHFANLAAKAKGLEASLLLAVMSIESNLNNITESSAKAQGLMQVMTSVHLDKLNALGGEHKVFEPQANIMVGATILADCIKLGGSVEMGLKCYVGASGPTDGGYGAKVLAEKERIEKARKGDYDFSANNKVLIEMGLIAPNQSDSQSSSNLEANQLSKNTASTIPATTTAGVITAPMPVQGVMPVLPVQPAVTLPAPAVSASALLNPALESPVSAAATKQK
jgi:hypothetical protein